MNSPVKYQLKLSHSTCILDVKTTTHLSHVGIYVQVNEKEQFGLENMSQFGVVWCIFVCEVAVYISI